MVPGVIFPDTVVDIGPVTSSGQQYDWVIEFQCVQVDSGNATNSTEVIFTGINFYHSQPQPGNETIAQMLTAARARGLGVYMDHGFGLYTVPQTNCSWSDL